MALLMSNDLNITTLIAKAQDLIGLQFFRACCIIITCELQTCELRDDEVVLFETRHYAIRRLFFLGHMYNIEGGYEILAHGIEEGLWTGTIRVLDSSLIEFACGQE